MSIVDRINGLMADPPPEFVKKWSVNTLIVSKNTRHSDKSVIDGFWTSLDGFLARKEAVVDALEQGDAFRGGTGSPAVKGTAGGRHGLVHIADHMGQVLLHAAHGITQCLAVLGQATQTGKDKYAHVFPLE